MSWILSRLKGDKVIWIASFLLALLSVLAIYSSSSALAFRMSGGDISVYLFKHLLMISVGLVVMFLVHRLNYRVFARLSNVLLISTIPLLLYTILRGAEINEAARWIFIFGQSFQPSDLAKVALVVYLAKLLASRQDVIRDFYEGFLPGLFWVTVICGLIAPTNLSTAILIFLSSMMIMFIAGVDLKYLGMLIGIALLGLVILVSTAKRSSTWESRVSDYVHRIADPTYKPNAQITQSHIAFATAGFFGKGAGKSAQRNFIPHAHADFIFAVIVEEYGLLGGVVVIGLYLLILFRTVGIVTASKTFGALMAAGLAFLMILQAMMNMGVTVGIFPVTGLPLPFISWGATSILITSVSLGIILSVSREALEGEKPSVPGQKKKKPVFSVKVAPVSVIPTKRKIQTKWANV